jgi:hypothetical protein
MKRAEVQLPDALYQQVEGLAVRLHVSVPELLSKAAEQMVLRQAKIQPRPNGDWQFPEGRHLGTFRVPVEDWRLLANEAAG